MTRKEALIALRDAVRAGMWPPEAAAAAFWLGPADCTENFANAENSYYGSLDAAKALHEAVLPGWAWDVGEENGSAYISLVREIESSVDDEWMEFGGDGLDMPSARAWLLAILEALIWEAVG
jgi:hypothetical protein